MGRSTKRSGWNALIPPTEAVPDQESGHGQQRKPRGKSRSSLYREIERNPELRAAKEVLKGLNKGLRNFKQKTLDIYANSPIFEGMDPETVKKSVRRTVRMGITKVAAAAHHRQAGERRKKALKLLAKGWRKKDVAKKIGMTDRGLRKLLNSKP